LLLSFFYKLGFRKQKGRHKAPSSLGHSQDFISL